MEQHITLPSTDLGRMVNNNWTATPLNNLHNADNPAEVQRLQLGHPGEDDLIQYCRVKGQLAVTRGMHATGMRHLVGLIHTAHF
jgi:hypothetical protein